VQEPTGWGFGEGFSEGLYFHQKRKRVEEADELDDIHHFGVGYSSDNSGDGPRKSGRGKGKKRNNGFTKDVLRSALKESMAGFVGPTLAKVAYKVGANQVGNIKRKVRKAKKEVSKMPMSISRSNARSIALPNGNLMLSDVSKKYIQSFLDPFNQSVLGVGVPRPGSMPSYKVTGFIRGTGSIGTLGVGFVSISPCVVNDRSCVFYTTSAYASTQVSQSSSDVNADTNPGSATSPASVLMTNLPYTQAQVTSSTNGTIIEGRIVSCSLKMYYTGTKLNESGQYYSYSDPTCDVICGGTHLDAVQGTGGPTTALLAQKDGCEITHVSGNTEPRLIVISSDAFENDYPRDNSTTLRKMFPYSQNNTMVDGNHAPPVAVIMITGVASQPFYFEAVTHVEYAGAGVVQSLLSESKSDVVGFDSIQCVIARAQRAAANDPRSNINKCIIRELNAEKITHGLSGKYSR